MRTAARTAITACLVFFAGIAQAAPPPRFPPHAVWHQDIRSAPEHPQSASMISTLAGLGGFGNGRMQIDFSLHVVRAPAEAPVRNIVAIPGDSYYLPDCEPLGTAMPVPTDAEIEGQSGLACDNNSGDCHLLVVQGDVLYEAYRANASGASGLESQCLAIWKLDLVYPDSGRGEHCTSADAAGFPMAPLLFNADEVHAAMQVPDGDLGHAIRFILPNARMASNPPNPGSTQRVRLYVRPASHAGGPSGPEGSVPYGSRLRLRADFPVNLYPAAAQVVLRTMQRHGIVLADGGTVALTAESDRYTTNKWSALGMHSRIFDQAVPSAIVRVQDFAVVDTGPRIIETYDCERNPEPSRPNGLAARVLPRRSLGVPRVVELQWQGGAAQVDIHRNGATIATVANTGSHRAKIHDDGQALAYMVCNIDSTACSGPVIAGPVRSLDPVTAPVY
jgi:serine/threonine-protein kinase